VPATSGEGEDADAVMENVISAGGETAAETNATDKKFISLKMLIQRLREHARRMLFTMTVVGVTFAVSAGLSFGAFATSDVVCDSRPVKLKDWFLGTALHQTVLAVLYFVLLISLCRLLSWFVTAEQRHREQNTTEADVENEFAQQLSQCCCGLFTGGCFVCLYTMFTVVWFILGIASVISAHSSSNDAACDHERIWFWAIFAVSLSFSIFCHVFCQVQFWRR